MASCRPVVTQPKCPKARHLRLSTIYTIRHNTHTQKQRKLGSKNKMKCCEFKGKQASKIESTSLCCRSYSVLHVRDQENEWKVFVE